MQAVKYELQQLAKKEKENEPSREMSVVITLASNKGSRLRAKKGPAPPHPLGNFADISYLEENFKPHLLRDVCTLYSEALVSDSLLHMLLTIKLRKKSKWKFELQKEGIKPTNYSNFLCSLQAGCLSYMKQHFKQNYSLQWCYMRYID